MAKFYGRIGFVETVESAPGVWIPKTTKRNYYVDVTRNGRRYENGASVNDNLLVTSQFSIIADPFALEHIAYLRWIEYKNVKWRISSAEIAYPRINLTLGGVYNDAGKQEETA